MSVFSDIEAEASVLNALLYDHVAPQEIFDNLTGLHFSGTVGAAAFGKLKAAWDNNTFTRELRRSISVEQKGTIHYREAIQILKSAEFRRSCVRIMRIMETLLHNPATNNADLAAMGLKISNCYTDSAIDKPKQIDGIVNDLIEKLDSGRQLAVDWGIEGMEGARLEAGVLAVIGARPSIGKTAFCCSSMLSMANLGIATGLICIEMDDTQIAARLISQESDMSYGDIWSRSYSEKEYRSFQSGVAKIKQSKIHLYCGRHTDMQRIETICTEWVKSQGVKAVFIDYIQRIKHGKADSERLRVGQSSYAMKLLARKLNIPVILCSQLNRDSENKRPTLKDLKESGDIEQDADIVYLLDRQVAGQEFKRNYEEQDMAGSWNKVNMEGKVALILAKNRNGKTGIEYIDFHSRTMKFS